MHDHGPLYSFSCVVVAFGNNVLDMMWLVYISLSNAVFSPTHEKTHSHSFLGSSARRKGMPIEVTHRISQLQNVGSDKIRKKRCTTRIAANNVLFHR